jgi:nucleotide-binding universal stress UspA family protein
MIKMERIICPVDFSDLSKEALAYAASFAKEYKAELLLVHVVEDVYFPVDPTSWGFSVAAFSKERKSAAEQGLTELAESSVPDEVKTETIVAAGTPFLEIIRLAKERDADLVVLSTHGRSGLAHVLMGSVAERVVRKAPCPVLVVRSGQHGFVMP